MTWTKLSDDFSDDCWTLSDAAFRLHVEGLGWSSRKLLDLRLQKDELRLWAKRPEAAGELVACGWWSDEGDHYRIRHHGCYQRPRDKVLAQQAANSRAGKWDRRAGRERGPQHDTSDSTTNGSSNDSSNDSFNERDRTGQARTRSTQPDEKNETSTHEKPEHNGVHLGCACGRPAPVNPRTGLCDYCSIKQRAQQGATA
jgi:hypothetical protein